MLLVTHTHGMAQACLWAPGTDSFAGAARPLVTRSWLDLGAQLRQMKQGVGASGYPVAGYMRCSNKLMRAMVTRMMQVGRGVPAVGASDPVVGQSSEQAGVLRGLEYCTCREGRPRLRRLG